MAYPMELMNNVTYGQRMDSIVSLERGHISLFVFETLTSYDFSMKRNGLIELVILDQPCLYICEDKLKIDFVAVLILISTYVIFLCQEHILNYFFLWF